MADFDSVIFDFDGTVADTGEGVFEGIKYAVKVEGLEEPSDRELRAFIGPPLEKSFAKQFPFIDEERIMRLINHFRASYSVTGYYKFTLYDGMAELLDSLRGAGIKTAIASSKPIIFINHILKTCDLQKYFDIAVGADAEHNGMTKSQIVAQAKILLEEQGCVNPLMVGDRKYDIVGAKDSDIPCAAVLFGYGSRDEFEKYKAEYIVKDCEELKKIIFN